MKTVLDQQTRDELIARIQNLTPHSTPQWGKMTVGQMLKHCIQWDEMAFGQTLYPRSFIGRIFGKIALKSIMRDEPMKPGLPTVPQFIINEKDIDTEQEKKKFQASIAQYSTYKSPYFNHPFFGKVTHEQTGQMAYKHIDHHLRQFGC
jgi:hypothetical protein